MQKNVLDGTWLSSIGLGWLTQIDWVFTSGLIIGIITIAVRIWEARINTRKSDLKERELHLKELEYYQRERESGRRKDINPQ